MQLLAVRWRKNGRNGPRGAVALAFQHQLVDHDRGQKNSPDVLAVLVQCCLMELSAVMEVWCLFFTGAPSQSLLSTSNVAGATLKNRIFNF